MKRTVLVTGGAGFIGSHVALDLLDAGHDVVVVDNLVNSSASVIDEVAALAGRAPRFVELDLRDRAALRTVLEEHPIDSCIHLAGLKAVGESVEQPLRYYDNNLGGTFVLLEELDRIGARDLVFSSSATVYGDAETSPVDESAPTGATNPYGHTKHMIEQILADTAATDAGWRIVSLRYFNPVGAHPSGRIGENPNGIPNNLMPRVIKVASGEWPAVTLFGDDYPTRDGTGVRDYIHVVDLAAGHRAALDKLDELPSWFVCNLGTGTGASVLELVAELGRACGRELTVERQPRRPGDVAELVADPSLARSALGWQAERGLDEMCADAWRFATAHSEQD